MDNKDSEYFLTIDNIDGEYFYNIDNTSFFPCALNIKQELLYLLIKKERLEKIIRF